MKSIIRAWKDPIYRAKLSAADQAAAANPAGMIELTGTDLDQVAGGEGGGGTGKSSRGSKSSKSKSSKSKSSKSKSSKSGKSSRSGKC
jgi:mersacidin/lichenicidin family type 2 lantibiotic